MTPIRPALGLSLLPIVILVLLLAADVVAFGEDSSYGSNQIALLLASGVAVAIGLYRGQKWDLFEQRIKDTLGDAIGAILILLLIGALAGTWLVSGIIPTLIDVGLDVLSREVFLPAACILCAAVSLATGSSWGTVGTVGVALIGIGQALGLSEGWIAGAIISGAYFGDKLSPLSDTDQPGAYRGPERTFLHTSVSCSGPPCRASPSRSSCLPLPVWAPAVEKRTSAVPP